jgi:hypothetical protein
MQLILDICQAYEDFMSYWINTPLRMALFVAVVLIVF